MFRMVTTRTALTRAVKRHMEAKGLSLRAMGAALDISTTTLHNRINGKSPWTDRDIDALHFAGVIDADDWAALVGYVSPLEVSA